GKISQMVTKRKIIHYMEIYPKTLPNHLSGQVKMMLTVKVALRFGLQKLSIIVIMLMKMVLLVHICCIIVFLPLIYVQLLVMLCQRTSKDLMNMSIQLFTQISQRMRPMMKTVILINNGKTQIFQTLLMKGYLMNLITIGLPKMGSINPVNIQMRYTLIYFMMKRENYG